MPGKLSIENQAARNGLYQPVSARQPVRAGRLGPRLAETP